MNAVAQRWLGMLLAGLLGASVFAASTGAMGIPWQRMPFLLLGQGSEGEQLMQSVLLTVRLPRVLFSMMTGAALACGGVLIQALFRNPLAEPGLVGISSGAALGAVTSIVMLGSSLWFTAPAAFAGSLLAAWLAYLVGSRIPGTGALLLAGIAINTIAGSVIGLFTYFANDAQLRDLTFWSMGSLAGANWLNLAVLFPWTVFLLIAALRQWRVLNALLLGDREARHLGFDLVRVRRGLMCLLALLIGPLVAVTGGIGFVGLVVPHLMRMSVGADHRWLLPLSALAGAVLLTIADGMARAWLAPAELPIGLITSLLGGPFFFYLLLRGKGGA